VGAVTLMTLLSTDGTSSGFYSNKSRGGRMLQTVDARAAFRAS